MLKYDAALLKGKYVDYALYKAPTSPREGGKFLFMTSSIETAIQICERAELNGENYFIKGVKEDGTQVLFL